jgi:hypothetical protein
MNATTTTSNRSTRTKSKKSGPVATSQTDGVATASDVALAAGLPASARPVEPGVSIAIVNLFRDAKLAASLKSNAAAIDAEGEGTVADMLGRIQAFVERYDALQRLSVSTARVRESLTQDNADFGRFATAVANVYKNAGKLSPVKADLALKKLAQSRDIQRGLPKMIKTRKKIARAKKTAAVKPS